MFLLLKAGNMLEFAIMNWIQYSGVAILKWSATPTNLHIPLVSTPKFIQYVLKFIHAKFRAFFEKCTIPWIYGA